MLNCKNPDSPKFNAISIAPPSQTPQKPQRSSFLSAMKQLWQLFVTAADTDEIVIWQTSDNNGNTWWHGCDRMTGRSIEAATENEMRAWLDRRYYQ